VRSQNGYFVYFSELNRLLNTRNKTESW